MKFDVESLIVPFLTGGVIVSSVKFVTANLKNAKLAAMIGGFPLGLFSIYFLKQNDGKAYGHNYVIITSILLLSAIVFNILIKEMNWSKEHALYASLSTWFFLAFLRYFVF